MTTVNYPNPVLVNGYSCRNCTEVDEAKKHIDPAHPQDGPFGVNAKAQPPNPADPHQKTSATGQSPAVTFGGVLAHLGVSAVGGVPASGPADPTRIGLGQRLDISA
jgi:hypothetical protein